MRIRYLNDDLFNLIQQHVDQRAVRQGENLEAKLTENFIEMGELIDVNSQDALTIIKQKLSTVNATNVVGIDISPSFENHLRNKWMCLSRADPNVDKTINKTLCYYKYQYGVSHFSISKFNEK